MPRSLQIPLLRHSPPQSTVIKMRVYQICFRLRPWRQSLLHTIIWKPSTLLQLLLLLVILLVLIIINRLKTITGADYADDIALLANTPAQAETLLHNLERAAAGIGLHVNAHKTEYICFNQTGDISTLKGSHLKLVDKFTYLGSSVSLTEIDINTQQAKAWAANDSLSVIWKSDLTNKMKRTFFQAAVVSIPLYGCTTWTLTKRMEKKLDSNYTRMLRAILNKSWRQHPTKQQLYGHLPPDMRDTAGEVGTSS